jgi:hypothetical protein
VSVEAPPDGLTFEEGENGYRNGDPAVRWVKVPDDYPCSRCRERGGWLPQVYREDCRMCYGEDPYGQPSFCAECEFCCGC